VYLGHLATSVRALVTSLGVPATRLEAPRITDEQSAKHIMVANAAGGPGIQQVGLESGRSAWKS